MNDLARYRLCADLHVPASAKLCHLLDMAGGRHTHTHTLWEMRDKYAEAVTESLENIFGDLDDKSNLPAALISAAQNAVDDNFFDYLSELHPAGDRVYLVGRIIPDQLKLHGVMQATEILSLSLKTTFILRSSTSSRTLSSRQSP